MRLSGFILEDSLWRWRWIKKKEYWGGRVVRYFRDFDGGSGVFLSIFLDAIHQIVSGVDVFFKFAQNPIVFLSFLLQYQIGSFLSMIAHFIAALDFSFCKW